MSRAERATWTTTAEGTAEWYDPSLMAMWWPFAGEGSDWSTEDWVAYQAWCMEQMEQMEQAGMDKDAESEEKSSGYVPRPKKLQLCTPSFLPGEYSWVAPNAQGESWCINVKGEERMNQESCGSPQGKIYWSPLKLAGSFSAGNDNYKWDHPEKNTIAYGLL